MKNILFYGDSNTWGYDSVTDGRFPLDVRFTGRLMRRFPQFHIIEEGLPGRTTAYDMPLEAGRNGLKTLPVLLYSASPLDLAVLMLGTNDCRASYGTMAQESAIALGQYVSLIRAPQLWTGKQAPEILIISPPRILPRVLDTEYGFYYSQHSLTRSEQLHTHYARLAERQACHYLDAALYAEPGPDGVHLDAENHAKLGEAVAGKLLEIFPGGK